MSRTRVAVLGSTGSIGRQALDVAARFPERIEIVALAAHASVDLLLEQARITGATRLALGDPAAAELARTRTPLPVGSGPSSLVEIAGSGEVDIVLNALVGAAGLRASIATLESGATLALANKESLVAGGDIIAPLGMQRVIPVDSEHSAIYQCLLGEPAEAVTRLWLTASGGPFRGRTADGLANVTRAQALAHPRWTMGPKITIDSATLMNKGLEVIEAHWLFGAPAEMIEVVVHPQSVIHSMVDYADGSVIAQLGNPDMRTPIANAMAWPERIDAGVRRLDLFEIARLDFERPDFARFPCLKLAFDALRAGGTAPAVLNAANEEAVAAFLDHRIGFLDIAAVIAASLERSRPGAVDSLEAVLAADAHARELARDEISRLRLN